MPVITKVFEMQAVDGSQSTERTVFVAEMRDGGKWYVQEGGTICHLTYDAMNEGVHLSNDLSDVDVATSLNPIESLEELEAFIES